MPVDENATRAALAQIARDGSDLNRPLSMDFFVSVPDLATGKAVASRTRELGFSTDVEQDSETGDWTCYCTKVIVPTYEAVAAIESTLDELASDMGGFADGFGTFGNSDSAGD